MGGRVVKVVVDANVVAALVLPLPYSDLAMRRFSAWQQAGAALLAPTLLEYEVAAVLRKAVVLGWLDAEAAAEVMAKILDLHVQCTPPTLDLHQRALQWADRLGQTQAYDGHYLALAEQQHAELWSADRRLVNGARQAGVPWVRWLGEK
jgi:predicted nucleic acid-binding protein